MKKERDKLIPKEVTEMSNEKGIKTLPIYSSFHIYSYSTLH